MQWSQGLKHYRPSSTSSGYADRNTYPGPAQLSVTCITKKEAPPRFLSLDVWKAGQSLRTRLRNTTSSGIVSCAYDNIQRACDIFLQYSFSYSCVYNLNLNRKVVPTFFPPLGPQDSCTVPLWQSPSRWGTDPHPHSWEPGVLPGMWLFIIMRIT